jgi:hypothetical protein
VVHTYNPSHSEGRERDYSLKPAWQILWEDPTSKNPITKKWSGEVAQDVGPEFKPYENDQMLHLFFKKRIKHSHHKYVHRTKKKKYDYITRT